ncbi:MAG TPA: endonuclease/exonuclease/phosphatase family protein [Bacteroidales bacterium]|nr:endonuclease/exonuclease/phosphatase family protein [Bacteroidales bacterium]
MTKSPKAGTKASPKKKRKFFSGKARGKDESVLRKLFYRILLAANIILCFSLLMAYLAVHISPDDFALPAFFGLAYPYLLLLNIIMIIIWAMLLRFEALISLVIILLGVNHLFNYIQLFHNKGDKAGTFSIMSYNVRMFNYFEGKKGAVSQKNIFDFVKSRKPDILCMQEFLVTGGASQAQVLVNTATGIKYNSHVKLLGSGKSRYYGIATFTRFPIVRKGEITHPHSSSITLYTDVLIGKDTVRIYNNYLQSFRLRNIERSFVEEMAAQDQETITEMKSISVSLKKGFINRSLQAQKVKDNIKRSPYPVIVAGDFNDTPVSYAYSKIRRGLNDSFVNSGYGAGFTYRGNYPPNRIDYVLYDKSLTNSNFEIFKHKYSDHYPIMAWFKIKG